MLRKYFYQYIEPAVLSLCQKFRRRGITPIQLTFFGVTGTLFAGFLYANGRFFWGTCALLIASLLDTLDGALARETKTTSNFGAFLDSTTDRYSDFFIFGGLLTHYAISFEVYNCLLVLAVLMGSYLTSYTKARAECLIKDCSVGIMGRAERIALVCVGGFFHLMIPVLWALAIATNLTALQRIIYTRRQLEQ